VRSQFGHKAIRLPVVWLLLYLAASFILRVVLLTKFQSDPAGLGSALSLLRGVGWDLVVGCFVVGPALIWALLFPSRLRTWRPIQWLRVVTFSISICGMIYLAFVDYYFFEEFHARFNYIAVDYLVYPHEVFVNIWQSYPVARVLTVCFIIAGIVTWRMRRLLWLDATPTMSPRARGIVLVALLAWFGVSWTCKLPSSSASDGGLTQEIGFNALYTFFYSLDTASLDYNQYYETLPESRVRGLARSSLFGQRDFHGDLNENRRKNLVFIIEESLGAEYSGAITGGTSHTVELDRLASEGVVFTNAFATGNRTIRGLEAALLSFPPLPGRSVIKRMKSGHMASLADVLKTYGYQTAFLYGGVSGFDNMGPFLHANGYERIDDVWDIKNRTFKTAWGVCDEDLFAHAAEVMSELATSSSPFFVTLLTVSNHKPYTYPEGRIERDPREQKRENAVQYADFALGQFARRLDDMGMLANTIVVVFGDHGARVYGSETFPLPSYQIPIVLFGDTGLRPGTRIKRLASSMDLAPTALHLLDIHVETPFYGRDLLVGDDDEPWIPLQHNRDVGLFTGDKLVVLGLGKTHEWFDVDEQLHLHHFHRVGDKDLELRELAVSLYQTAYEQFTHQSYRLACQDNLAGRSHDVGAIDMVSSQP